MVVWRNFTFAPVPRHRSSLRVRLRSLSKNVLLLEQLGCAWSAERDREDVFQYCPLRPRCRRPPASFYCPPEGSWLGALRGVGALPASIAPSTSLSRASPPHD